MRMPRSLSTLGAVFFVSAGGFAQVAIEPLLGLVVGPDGKPVAGARVEVWRSEGMGFTGLDLEYAKAYTRIAATPTDKQGRFALQTPVGLLYELRIDHAPHARWMCQQSHASGELHVRLQSGATLQGRLKAHDGAPATGRIRAWFVDSAAEVCNGRSDDTGAFAFDRLPVGSKYVEVLPDTAPSPEWLEIELAHGATVDHEIRLAKGVMLQGRVVDASTGAPIEGAGIGEGWTLRRRQGTDRDGRYELRGYGSPEARDVHCKASGYVEQIVRRPDMNVDPMTLDFRMERGVAAAGRVVDPDGKPAAGIYVRIFGTHHDGKEQVHDCIGVRTGPGGEFLVGGLRPSLDHVVVIRRDGWATAVYALPAADQSNMKQAGDLPLSKACVARGSLLDGDGKPLPHQKVILWGYNADRHLLDPDRRLAITTRTTHAPDSWGLLDMYVGGHETYSNADGHFAIADLPAGRFRFVAYAANNRRIFVGEPFTVPGEAGKPFELVADK
jgi:protocatechuate 3,4-dioxygenase beta subunit